MKSTLFNPSRIVGTSLNAQDQAKVLSCFVHRFTGNHRPAWAQDPMLNGNPYPVQFADDKDWLANTEFSVKADGSLDGSYTDCYSRPTWPNNPELGNRPFRPGGQSMQAENLELAKKQASGSKGGGL